MNPEYKIRQKLTLFTNKDRSEVMDFLESLASRNLQQLVGYDHGYDSKQFADEADPFLSYTLEYIGSLGWQLKLLIWDIA